MWNRLIRGIVVTTIFVTCSILLQYGGVKLTWLYFNYNNNSDFELLAKNQAPVRSKNTLLKLHNITQSKISRELTVVTAFFDLGNFSKGIISNVRSIQTYSKWTAVFRYMTNPLVVYTDIEVFAKLMRNLRQNVTMKTKINVIQENNSWAFGLYDPIKNLYSKPGYPRFHPNTVRPKYTCTVHAKFEFTANAAKENYFKTSHIGWLDIGYFRGIASQSKYFRLDVPRDLKDSHVGLCNVYKRSMSVPIKDIILKKMDWVGGGLFIGTMAAIQKFEEDYKNAVLILLGRGLMNSEQQVLYAMFSDEGRNLFRPETDIKLYGTGNEQWFYLGYNMLHYI